MYSTLYAHVCTGSRRHFNFVYRHKSIRLLWPGLAMSSSQIYSSQVTSHFCPSRKSQKLVTPVRLESTINAVIGGIHVHRSVKFLVLSWGPAKFFFVHPKFIMIILIMFVDCINTTYYMLLILTKCLCLYLFVSI